ncbi:hypothetical protein [Caproicibacter fermentans]|uniref:Uncharacterized protein n=1 Tax=Caproicibacter fermentans TaxID=2576756 RepID=A0A7G8TE15_9FIRM|nr:hypothetical protein [Caproicibacter fermentans]QNK41856.1 hypothetical protein HCR03_06340 [Caproicibacter fermentans]
MAEEIREKAVTEADSMAKLRELAAEIAKLPESVQMKILYMIEGARLVSEAKRAG